MRESFPRLLELDKINGGKKIYFASDFHLGAPNAQSSFQREKLIADWFDKISEDASHVFLLGDIFDFWFEYKHCIPKGFDLFKTKLAELRIKGIPVYFFTGNHDMWLFDYFPKEFGIPILRENQELKIAEKTFLVGHGDGLGPGDHFYKFLKAFFANPVCQFLFEWIHPNIGMGLANFWSSKSRLANGHKDEVFVENKERLLSYCRDVIKSNPYDYLIFGHRHLPLDLQITEKSRYINLGEWVNYCTYAEYDGDTLVLTAIHGDEKDIIRKDYTNNKHPLPV